MTATADTTDFAPQPPQDLSAEQSVLGGMLLSKDAIADVVDVITGDQFYRVAHQKVYATVMDLYARGEPADTVTVAAELERRGELGKVGGAPYLLDLLATVPTAANAGYYAQIVREKATLRLLAEAGARVWQMAYGGAESDEVTEVVDRAQQAFIDAVAGRGSEDFTSIGGLMTPTYDELDAIAAGRGAVGVPTGYHDIDAVIGGLRGGQMIIIAARPGVGKSTMGMDIARHCSLHLSLPSAFFSLEMSSTELVMRVLSAEARVRLQDMRCGRMGDQDWITLAHKMSEFTDSPMFIDDSPNLTMMEIRAKARRLAQRDGLRLIVVDYLQLLTSGRRAENRQQEVSDFSRQLKLLAKELDVPVIAISQLNRGPEQRADNRPMLADLRESGSLEQDADLVFLLNRPDLYDRDSPRAGEIDVIMAKHRAGPTPTIQMVHQLHYSRLMDYAGESTTRAA